MSDVKYEGLECWQYLRQAPGIEAIEKTKSFEGKKMVWVTDPAPESKEGYYACHLEKTEGDMCTLKAILDGKEWKCKKDDLQAMNPPKFEKAEDMASLTFLNEASVLYNLKARYCSGLIYTYSGLFCVTVNPYKRLPIYTDEVINIFRGKRRQEVPPHVFSIVDNAYQDMLINHDNQSLLITGESGAGKTENTKKVIQYVAKVAGVEKGKGQQSDSKMKGGLDEQVVQANPLLEAYGNAKTIRNHNSSRFGKFIRCHFSQQGKLAGADIESYLLEKSRVVNQLPAERNYHIFYQLIYTTTDEMRQKLLLTSQFSKDYPFMAKGVPHVDAIDDFEEFAATETAARTLLFSDDEILNMYKICAAILNFSCMTFKQKPRDEQAEVADPASGEKVGFLLGVPVTEFHKNLTKPKVKVGTEMVNKAQNVAQVSYSVSALSKACYERMFWETVRKANVALETRQSRSYFIGVLDIAGFEIFDYNTFEQLCINLTNEKLQQFFNHHMFILEQEEYKKEGIIWEFIDFGLDLESTIALIEKPMGIFAILEEECIVPKGTDKSLLEKMHKTHAGKHNSYGKPALKQKGDFLLFHYAGTVAYHVGNWLEKNKDPINESVAQLFAKSSNALVCHIFQDYHPDVMGGGRRKGSAFQTVSSRHKEQLHNLLTTLGNTSPHFVRCIIPNEEKTPLVLWAYLCLHQLRCNGVLEGIRICRKGFPSRMLFQDFRNRYKILAPNAIPTTGFIDGKAACDKLITTLQLETTEYRVGLTKVFFKAGVVGELEEMRDERLSKIIGSFQAYCKGFLMRKEYKKMCEQRIGMSVIQRNVRNYLSLKDWDWWKLFTKVKPMLNVARAEDEMKIKEDALKLATEKASKEEEERKKIESQFTATMEEKNKLLETLNKEQDRLLDAEEKIIKLQVDKDKFETQMTEALEKLEDEESTTTRLEAAKHSLEAEKDDLINKIDVNKSNISRLEQEKCTRDNNISALNQDIATLDNNVSKLSKEKKHLEENLQEQINACQAEEDKVNHLTKTKKKLEENLSETEHNFKKEKDTRARVEREKRKTETELKSSQDMLSETQEAKTQVEDTLIKRDKLINELTTQLESEQRTIIQLQKKIQELLRRIEELEEELENERKAKQKAERARSDLQSEYENLQDKLEEQGGATTQQVEMNKKREAEISKVRKDLEETIALHESAMSQAKQKFNAQLQETEEELETAKKSKQKLEKDKMNLVGELDEVNQVLETVKKGKMNSEKSCKALEEQQNENKAKLMNYESVVAEMDTQKTKLQTEANSLNLQLEEVEHRVSVLQKNNKSADNQLGDMQQSYEDEQRAKLDAQHKLQKALHEIEQMQEQLEEEQRLKSAVQQNLSKAAGEASLWKNKYESDGASRVEDLEEAKKKLGSKVQEMEEALQATELKAQNMEKIKNRMNGELEDLMLDLEKAQGLSSNLEKKQKKVDAQINEWKNRCDELQLEVDNSQRESRAYSTELLKLRTAHEETLDTFDALKKDNKLLHDELRGATSQLSEGGKSSHEVEKLRRKMELEKEELSIALEEIEGALEQEEGKVLKVQLELTQARQIMERKISEKDEEADNMRKNHQRQMDSMQSTIDSEQRAKQETIRIKKKLEGDLAEMESSIDTANRVNTDQLKTVKKLQLQIKESQAMFEEQQRNKSEGRDGIIRAEKRVNDLQAEIDEYKMNMEQSERSRKLAENERNENAERNSELQTQVQSLMNSKRKVEGDFHSLQDEVEIIENDARGAEDRANKSMAEVARLQAELSQLQDISSSAEKSKTILEKQLRESNSRLEEAEASGGKNLKNQIRKLEQKCRDLESGLDDEARKNADIVKLNRRFDKKAKDLQFQIEEDHKNVERAKEQSEKMNQRLRKMKQQLEEAESLNATNGAKLKKALMETEDAEERAETAEQALQKARARARAGGSQSASSLRTGTRGASGARSPRSRGGMD